MSGIDQILAGYAGLRDAQEEFYKDLHQHPELSHQEQRTARRAAEWLQRCGYEVRAGIGGTGVVGVLANGSGPQISTSRPPAAVSSSRRSYRLCTRRDTTPHPGHAAAGPHVLAWTRTDRPATNTRSTSTSFRCGSRTSATSRRHGQHDHKRRDQGTIRHAGHLTETVPEPEF